MALKTFSLSTSTTTLSHLVRLSPPPVPLIFRLPCKHFARKVVCLVNTQSVDQYSVVTRRSANYEAPLWDYDFVQSLKSDYNGEKYYAKQAKQLKEKVLRSFEDTIVPLEKLKVIDALQRLGVGYLFEKEIKEALNSHSINCRDYKKTREDLHATALQFRLLRQHGFIVSQDIFNRFKDENGNFNECLGKDTKGILSLYEASYLGFPEETMLDEARDFCIRHLNDIKHKTEDKKVSSVVEHALEFPLQWRVPKFEARWYISVYENEEGMNPKLLQLAKLDYNQTQALYQGNLQETSRWWKAMGLGEKMRFSRDRLVESCLWAIAVASEPQSGYEREGITKMVQLISTIDDVYDVYGSLHELQLFTDAFDRWDLSAKDQLPEYMQLCYLALFNTVNITGYKALKEEGLDIIPYLKRKWTDLCKAFLVEAEWFSKGHTPSLEEYLNNASVSIAVPIGILVSYILSGQKITEEAIESLERNPDIIQFASIICQLADDLGTSSDEMARGDVSKAVQCYMREKGVTEEVARQHLYEVIKETWKKLNKVSSSASPSLQPFLRAALNLAWDLSAKDQLPEYMQLCYLALFNTVNIMGYKALKEEGLDIIPYLKRKWTDLCKAFLVEAEWFSKGYTPRLEEYLNNPSISIAVPIGILVSYILSGQKITEEAIESLERNPDIVRFASIICRLADDLGTSSDEMARGDVSKAVQCYMREKGVTEEVARQHLYEVIKETWKNLNKFGDGFVGNRNETGDLINSLLVDPIALNT